MAVEIISISRKVVPATLVVFLKDFFFNFILKKVGSLQQKREKLASMQRSKSIFYICSMPLCLRLLPTKSKAYLLYLQYAIVFKTPSYKDPLSFIFAVCHCV